MARQDARWTRRRLIGSGAGVLAAAAVPLRGQSTPVAREQPAAAANLTGRVARYMAAAREHALPADVVREAKHRILDTHRRDDFRRPPEAGRDGHPLRARARRNARSVRPHDRHPHVRPSTRRSPTAMFAHADETDDFEPVTKAHPGCSAVPAALAMGERENGSART